MWLRRVFFMRAPQMRETDGRRCGWEQPSIRFFSGGLGCATLSATQLRRAPGTAALFTSALSKPSRQNRPHRNYVMFEISLAEQFALPSLIRSVVVAGIIMLIALIRPSWADEPGALPVFPPVEAAAAISEHALAVAAVAGEIAHKQQLLRLFPNPTTITQPTPAVIPQMQIDGDPSGMIATFQPSGPTPTASNAFFQNLGTNGRTCFTCHEPQDGWSLSAQHAQARFNADPNDPLFRRVDGATCPSDDVSTLDAERAAYSLLTSKGLIRIGLPMQSAMEFQILQVDDPYGCTTSAVTGLTGSKSGIVSVYRRPPPAANLGFLSTIMLDGREDDLFQQSVDATLTHAQGNPPGPSPNQQQQIVTFEGCTTALSTTANPPDP